VVDELLDYLELLTEFNKEYFTTKHPLHGFDERYFNPNSTESLFSYSKIYLRAAESVANFAKKPLDDIFCSSPLPLTDKISREYSFQEFVSFFISPSKFFLKNALNINLYDEATEPLKTTEPFEINKLEEYAIKNDALEHKLKNKDFDIYESLKASGMIPSGVWGDEIMRDTEDISEKLYEAILPLGDKRKKTQSMELKFDIEGFELTLKGEFDNLYETSQAFFRPGTIKDKDKLKAWIWHQLAVRAGIDISETTIIGLDIKQKKVKTMNIVTSPLSDQPVSAPPHE
jgi:exonuclease V gamma subunit